jgi:hypothetical protein
MGKSKSEWLCPRRTMAQTMGKSKSEWLRQKMRLKVRPMGRLKEAYKLLKHYNGKFFFLAA